MIAPLRNWFSISLVFFCVPKQSIDSSRRPAAPLHCATTALKLLQVEDKDALVSPPLSGFNQPSMTAAATENERAPWAEPRARLDPFRPQGCFVEAERSANGEVVSVTTVLLTNRECPWRCVFCDLWKNTTIETVPIGAIPSQIDFALNELRGSPCRQIKLYNAGSFFDPKAVPPGDFPAVARRVAQFERIIVECHPALVGASAVRFRDSLAMDNPATQLEVAMGLEVADDALLARMNKRMTLAMFRRAAEFLVINGIDVRAFVIVKPPFVRTDGEATTNARRSIEFAFECGATAVSLIPARFGPDGLGALARAGDFSAPGLATIEESFDFGLALGRGRVFVDLWDIERIDGCPACRQRRIARLQEMNLGQMILPHAHCECQS